MALKTEERRIGAHTYQTTQLPGTLALRTLTELGKMIGPALGELAKDEHSIRGLLDQKVENLGGAIAVLADDVDPDRLEAIAKRFAGHSKVRAEDGGGWLELNETIFDQTFGGAVDELFGWLAFCLQVNYANFFDVARKATGHGSGRDAPAAGK